MSKSSFLQLFKLQTDALPKMNVDCSGDDVRMFSSGNFKFEKDVSIKTGVASYINIGVKFSELDTYNNNFYQQYQDDLKVDRDKSLLEIVDRKDLIVKPSTIKIEGNGSKSEQIKEKREKLQKLKDLLKELKENS